MNIFLLLVVCLISLSSILLFTPSFKARNSSQQCQQIQYDTQETGCCTCRTNFRGNGYCQCEYEDCGTCYYGGTTCWNDGVPSECNQDRSQPIALLIDPEIIRQIAAVHPRFASTVISLAQRSQKGTDLSYGKAYLTPVPITASDIEILLQPDDSKEKVEFKKAWDIKARELNFQKVQPVIYIYTLEEDGSSATLRLVVSESSRVDPPANSLSIKLSMKLEEKPYWAMQSWRID